MAGGGGRNMAGKERGGGRGKAPRRSPPQQRGTLFPFVYITNFVDSRADQHGPFSRRGRARIIGWMGVGAAWVACRGGGEKGGGWGMFPNADRSVLRQLGLSVGNPSVKKCARNG